MAKGGKRPGSGRKPGVPNKITGTIKMAMQESFERLGGVEWLIALGKTDKKAYATLLAKIIPLQVVGDVTRPFVALIPAPSGSPEEWLKTYSHLASQTSPPSASKH